MNTALLTLKSPLQWQVHRKHDAPGPLPKIALPTNNGFDFLTLSTILYFKSAGNYSHIYTVDGRTTLMSLSLIHTQSRLPSSSFIRIHHSYIINLEHLIRYEKGDGGTVYLANGIALPVSREKKKKFLKMVCGGACEE
jgi:two-component system LytT family response regulator